MNNLTDEVREQCRRIEKRVQDGLPITLHSQILIQTILELAQPILASRVTPPARQPYTLSDHDL